MRGEVKVEKNTERGRKGKKTQKELRGVWDLQDNMKHNNIHIIGMLEGEEEEQGIE